MDLTKLFTKKEETEAQGGEDAEHPRLPPGQYLTKKWPVLSYESTPKFNPEKWQFKVTGLVEEPFTLQLGRIARAATRDTDGRFPLRDDLEPL